MWVESSSTRATIRNSLLELAAEVRDGRLSLTLSALCSGSEIVPILRRVGTNRISGALQAEIPKNSEIQVTCTESSAALVVGGTLAGAEFWLNLQVCEESPWVQVSEALAFGAREEPPLSLGSRPSGDSWIGRNRARYSHPPWSPSQVTSSDDTRCAPRR
jgi:hypothetical protein